jgi:hypothetical protein
MEEEILKGFRKPFLKKESIKKCEDCEGVKDYMKKKLNFQY